ncbi:hypothetical protein CPAV1605_630 [seawater metagenome]|uniref:Uncharacterized protein n=1 Tax=seawater metagenome TaxID=1561972 RepID=A0A5E8CLI3_9ZZZZ
MNKTLINSYLIEPAENLILLLSRPSYVMTEFKENSSNVYNKWILNFVDLYNNKNEFLMMARLDIQKTGFKKERFTERNFQKNYELVIYNFELIKKKNMETEDISLHLVSNNELVVDNYNKKLFQDTIFGLLVCVFQYLQEFDNKSIKINLWNYCLKSMTFSIKSFIVGFMLLLCQYTWIIALIYNVINDFEVNNEPMIIMITTISTIISIFYSYISINSFIGSCSLYRFLLKIYTDNNKILLTKEEKQLIYYKNRYLTMTKYQIIYNWIADGLSNFILPIIIPIVNIFIILNSESIVDAILNCMAIFFIIQIDEDIYQISDYQIEQQSINFTKWIIACIYCKYIPDFEPIIKKELSIWQKLFKNCVSKYKRNAVIPEKH